MVVPELIVDVRDGLGVVEVRGDGVASVLRLRGRPALVEGADARGSIGRLAALAGSGAARPEQLQVLREWLAAPDVAVDAATGTASPPPDGTRLGPLLRLLTPGAWRIRAYVPQEAVAVVDTHDGVARWYPDQEHTLVATDTWPPADAATVTRYRRRIAAGDQPAAVVLCASTDTASGYLSGYLLDGHHKLAAYHAERLEPLLIELSPARPARLHPAELAALLPPEGRAEFSDLLRALQDPSA